MGILNRLATKTWSFRSRVYLQHLQKRLKNREFSLITNDCVGGVICHNLNMPFLSPTVNLWMTAEDYLVFLSDLPYFLSCPVEEIHEEGINYPIGLLRKGTETVKLYFMHYESFEQAVEKWTSRAKRVLFDRLYAFPEAGVFVLRAGTDQGAVSETPVSKQGDAHKELRASRCGYCESSVLRTFHAGTDIETQK